jgi:hypothetical protein
VLTPFLYPVHPSRLIDVSDPKSYEDLVEQLIPVLMGRGIMWKDYAVPGGTFRENLRREKDVTMPPTNHPGARFQYDELKERLEVDEFGDITITTKRPEEKKEDVVVNGVKKMDVGETAKTMVAKS